MSYSARLRSENKAENILAIYSDYIPLYNDIIYYLRI